MKSKIPLLVLALMLTFSTASADQVISDDLITNGSHCVGLDCANGEVFNFRTLVLKENNLRMAFQDTSTSASFPSTDWQLTANDSSNGGRNHFSIEDLTATTTPFTVMGGAPTAALFVDPSGNVGAGTDSPLAKIHAASGDTPSIRLDQTGDLGWDPYVWDLAANEGSFVLRDAVQQTRPFVVESGAVDDALVVHADGNVTIAGTLAQGSSRAIKNIFPLAADDVLAKLKSLEVSRWQYKNDEVGGMHIGPMAEDFHHAFGLGADNKHITSSDVAGVTMSSMQALLSKVEEQERELDELKVANKTLEARLTRIEKRLLK